MFNIGEAYKLIENVSDIATRTFIASYNDGEAYVAVDDITISAEVEDVVIFSIRAFARGKNRYTGNIYVPFFANAEMIAAFILGYLDAIENSDINAFCD